MSEHVSKNYRRDDHETSMEAAESMESVARNLRHRILAAYLARPWGITDDEAAELVGVLDTCYWKRCGELRRDRLIEIVYDDKGMVTKVASKGRRRMVCRITSRGVMEAGRHRQQAVAR